ADTQNSFSYFEVVASYLEELFWEHRVLGCGAKRSASSSKDIFMKRGLIAEEVAWGTPCIRLWRKTVSSD
ncbi:hypothetical protein, partial [Enterococcus thailandicus]|uniref:hypothetical protein n=1 Tax=Enterococcus thailandicus TaxID=417368 RepID=UPI00372D100D